MAPEPLARLNRRWQGYNQISVRYDLEGVSVHRPRYWQIPSSVLLGLRHRSFARCLVESVTESPDVIHAHYAYPCGLGGVTATFRSRRPPVVLTLHGNDVNVMPERGRRARRFFSEAVRRANAVSAVSQALADRTARLSGRRPIVAPIGIDLRPYRTLPDKLGARDSLGIPEDVRVVLFVGAVVASKGVDLLKEALERIGRPDVLGVFIGNGALRAEIARAPRTLAPGAVPHAQVRTYMRAADVLVLPSLHEGMPTVLVEAGAAGLPVIASNVGGIGELLGDDRGVTISSGSLNELIRALRIALDRPDEMGERAARLKQHVESAYDVDVNARNTLLLYESLL
jgi:teichuronic acid biosynthesis glycosyltransferase TuaC